MTEMMDFQHESFFLVRSAKMSALFHQTGHAAARSMRRTVRQG
jgi:hypothetical protein